jgi:tetratricopeptide (TPR) repeat protein
MWLLSTTAAAMRAFDDANRRYEAGDFAGAAAAYEKLLAAEGSRAAVLYNLGNSYQRLGQHGPAILAYERARLLTPRDPDLRANLGLARKAAATIEEPAEHPRLHAALQFLSRNEWSWLLAGTALFLGGLALVSGVMKLPRRGMRQMVVISTFLACLLLVASAAALYLRGGEEKLGVVLSENATVRLSPFESAEALGSPRPGQMVRLGGENGGFHYVEVPAMALRGWLAREDLAALRLR